MSAPPESASAPRHPLLARATLAVAPLRLLVLLLPLLLPPTLTVAAPATATPTNTIITCLEGAVWQPTNALFRGSVRVFDPQLYLECDQLNVYFPSNSANRSLQAGATPSLGSISSIVAQSNLLMMLRGATLIGDRATYSAAQDLIHITGEIVVIETESGYAYGTNFMFNRVTLELQSIGPSTLESKPGVSLMDGTNSLAPPGTRPRRNPAGARPTP